LNPASDRRVSEIISKEGIKIHRPLIGIALRDNLYPHLNEISKVINYLILNMDASIIFIPHFSSLDTSYFYYDPRFIARKLLEKIDARERITVIQGEYTVEELRGLIGKCDLFIGAYMHANISALSMCVPTIAISYSHKTYGIMDSVGLSELVLNINELTATNLINKIEKMYNNIHKYREHLKQCIPIIQEAVLKLGRLTPGL
jgi:colanic acid/amylovoran biosynthesis protein